MSYIQPIEITKFDKNRWVVSTPQGNHLIINERTRSLPSILKDTENNNEALVRFNQTFDQDIDIQTFEGIVQNKFQDLDILLSDTNKKFRKISYMTLKIKLLNKKVAGFIAAPFSFLYQPFLFWLILSASLIGITFIGWSDFSFEKSLIQPDKVIIYTVILCLTMLVHEVGHIAACRKFGIDHGEVGFGFYLIFPVVYADVTKIWTLDKHKRTIANLGGIYLELVYASILTAIYLYTAEMVFLAASVFVFIKTLTELNPFIRYDGYWVLSDLTNTPNLLPKANGLISYVFSKKNNYSESVQQWQKKHFLLFAYGVFNWILITIYISWILIEKWDDVVSFPSIMARATKAIIMLDLELFLIYLKWDNIIVLGFYILVIKFLIKYLLKIYKRNRSVTKLDLNGLSQVG
jgi:putative peptide zinc metalloprotease protein